MGEGNIVTILLVVQLAMVLLDLLDQSDLLALLDVKVLRVLVVQQEIWVLPVL
jgi:hypothetical protein